MSKSIVQRLEDLKFQLSSAISAQGRDTAGKLTPAYDVTPIIVAQQMLEREIVIKLTYFKASGKYYSEGELGWPLGRHMFDLFDHVKQLKRSKHLPGLETGHSDYIVHIDTSAHPLGYPGLIP